MLGKSRHGHSYFFFSFFYISYAWPGDPHPNNRHELLVQNKSNGQRYTTDSTIISPIDPLRKNPGNIMDGTGKNIFLSLVWSSLLLSIVSTTKKIHIKYPPLFPIVKLDRQKETGSLFFKSYATGCSV